jgi:hypothetical protein
MSANTLEVERIALEFAAANVRIAQLQSDLAEARAECGRLAGLLSASTEESKLTTRKAILAVLNADPARVFRSKDLIALSGMHGNSVPVILKRLVEAGEVRKIDHGLYQAVKPCP